MKNMLFGLPTRSGTSQAESWSLELSDLETMGIILSRQRTTRGQLFEINDVVS